MRKNLAAALMTLLFSSIPGSEAGAAPKPGNASEPIRVSQIAAAPVIDGKLDDPVWNRPADICEIFKSYSPTFGEALPFKTRVWMAHDFANLYFAFHCLDSEPEKIKSSVTRRDDMWKDDWIGFNIDTLSRKRFGYVLCANPRGIQGDLYDSPATGIDFAPDYIWYSAGRIGEDGYIVEMKIPLDGFRYRSGRNVEMNIIFERKITRLGLMGSWPEVPAGRGFFPAMAKIVFDELHDPPRFKAIPALTYGNSWDRHIPSSWSRGDHSSRLGITAGYRVTSSMTAEATINPDFSQVESDAFQVLVNRRYPTFYMEKRPFFMEAAKAFDLAGSGSEAYARSFITAVHTRNVVDPSWGAKIGGSFDNISFGAITAMDSWPGRHSDPEGVRSFAGKEAFFLMGRIKHGIGSDNYVGAILTGRAMAGGFNRVIGGDVYYRFGGGNSFLKSFVLHSVSRDQRTGTGYSGSALTLDYAFYSKPMKLSMNYEYLEDDFRMDTAFIRRAGISKFTSSLAYNLYPDPGKIPWIKRISPGISGFYLHDVSAKENDYELNGAVEFKFIRQGSISTMFSLFREYWRHTAFEGRAALFRGMIQMTNWMNLDISLRLGDRIFYDASSPSLGEGREFDVQLLLQPTPCLSQSFNYMSQALSGKQDHHKLYGLNIFISRTSYQVNRHLFLRAIIQYDSSLEAVLTDALLSFTLTPDTVFHLGYGGFYENPRSQIGPDPGDHFRGGYELTRRSVFLKVSYVLRF